MAACPVPRALETRQTKVVLIISSDSRIRSLAPWGTAERGRGPEVLGDTGSETMASTGARGTGTEDPIESPTSVPQDQKHLESPNCPS